MELLCLVQEEWDVALLRFAKEVWVVLILCLLVIRIHQ